MTIFGVTLSVAILPPAAPAHADPAVDPYPVWTQPVCQSFVEQPGVKEFRDMILSRIGGTSGGIHACSGFEHGEGRAWDWMMDAPDPAEAAKVRQVLDWLLATDAAGTPHAMARRLGIGNIIWNRQSIELWSYDPDKVWEPYGCSGNPTAGNCHTNHVHFAFSWQGARRQTTWFTTSPKPPAWYPDHADHRDNTGRLGDFNGDGKDDVLAVDGSGSMYVYPGNGVALGTPYYVGNGWHSMSSINVGDLNGDGRDDVLAVDGSGSMYVYPGNGVALGTPYYVGNGWHSMSSINVGDLNGDGRDDVLAVDGSGSMYVYPGNGTALGARYFIGNGWNGVAFVNVGDLNGDGRDDVLAVDGSGSMYVYPGNGAALGARYFIGNGWNGMAFVN
ncbi:FG-GAP repeat domain-containing protein [Plantactinospora solaniradicis]|uniref:FG-GAP repeat domain-containing protein n=1 Tax=Plantactinospora solaniradicis TaxID=1723736 RepID=A0ABW1KKJ6_9ACTN